ncbi:MAG: DNA polymerase, partial [Nanohaloarchaea archaeon]|nr:DNA polymerase [Candidatus Nanohaloarchaea archaeon]
MSWLKVKGTEIKTKTRYSCDTTIMADVIEKKETGQDFPKLNILAFDLETIPIGENRQQIIMASLVSSKGLRRVLTYQKATQKDTIIKSSEKELIEELIKEIQKERPDFIVTYNGDQFDFTVLKDRADLYRLTLDLGFNTRPIQFLRRGMSNAAIIKGSAHIDLYQFIFKVMRTTLKSETLTLDNVADELIQEKKLDMDFEDMFRIWKEKKDLKTIAEYNLHDSVITLKLAEYILPNIFAMCHLTNQIPTDAARSTYGQLVESFAMKKAAQLNTIIPNRPSSDTISERKRIDAIEGAFVVEPKPGLYANIAVLDFKSLYPSIIVSHNISPDTFDCDCCKNSTKNKVPDFPYHFCEKRRGFIPIILEELLNGRAKVKAEMKNHNKGTQEYILLDKKQYAFKTVANAFYGYLGFAGSRWYKRECAESVTSFGRNYIHKTISEAERYKLETVYGDTDSLFLLLKNNKITTIDKFLRHINENLPGMMELEFEDFFKSGIFAAKKSGTGGAKKRYALLKENGDMKVRGFERVRRDWSSLAKDTQETVMRLVLTGKKEEATDFVKTVITDLKKGNADLETLIIHSQLTMPIEKYVQMGPHVAAAKKAQAQGLKIEPGTVLKYIITKGAGSISDRAYLSQFAKDYDPNYYINHQILPASLRILSAVGITEDQLLNKGTQKGLFSFSKK